uniref:C-type lectin domain-containing protein n=1 Tax=Gopherus agassizii TaxID=38772 RepID=A0A452HJY3_9SAUR
RVLSQHAITLTECHHFPHWHQMALRVSGAANVILLGAMMALSIWGELCAPNWLLHGDKCYWLSKESKKWNESREDCSAKSSQMLMSQDQREMAFIKTITEGKYSIWIGLHLTTSKGNWTWVDGSLLESPCNLIIVAVRGAKCKALLGWLAKVTFTPGGTR